MNKRGIGGFALPTVLVASIIMMIVLLSAVGSSTSIRSAIIDQYYNQLARSAADSGIAYAQACLESNGVTWSDSSPLGPNTDCYGVQLAGFTCIDNYSEPRCFASFNDKVVSTFSVTSPDFDSTGEITKIYSKGITALLRSSDNTPRRQYSHTSQLIVNDSKSSTLKILVVAGGGGGGSRHGGGGGGGGVISKAIQIEPLEPDSYSVVVGGGGTGGLAFQGSNLGYAGANGTNSSFDTLVAIGGGGGGSNNGSGIGLAGGSGGGGTVGTIGGVGSQLMSSSGGFGNSGGAGLLSLGNTYYMGGGGGGAGGVGGSAVYPYGGVGGLGRHSDISGVNVSYAAGGSGGVYNLNTVAVSGAVNTGRGGGGSGGETNNGGNGGSGIVIISYPTGSITATGGTITTVGGNTIHTFTSGSSTFTIVSNNSKTSDSIGAVKLLVVAGGGGGGGTGSGGGGGGYIYKPAYSISAGAYPIVVGNGGKGFVPNGIYGPGAKGENSSFSNLVAEGGGNGTTHGGKVGGNGGSGGGGSISVSGSVASGGLGSRGNSGGAGFVEGGWVGVSGGGGGAGGVGANGGYYSGAGNGGAGMQNSISGSPVYYAAGGGGGLVNGSTFFGVGGSGVGGNGSATSIGGNGVANTGSGGGGGAYAGVYYSGGNGASGIVVVSYPTGSIDATGGTITTSGGNTIHTFTSGSGVFNVIGGKKSIYSDSTGAVKALVVAGGGGGVAGGGGAGGVVYKPAVQVGVGTYSVAVGSGGAGGVANAGAGRANGQNSDFNGIIAIGGGAGSTNDSAHSANGGGSGGGGGSTSTVQTNGGTRIDGQGNIGGTVTSGYFVSPFPSAGGGGAGAAGSNPTGATVSGNGGVGLAYSITGSSVYYGGGGGGGTWNNGTHGTGGNGGGGAGGYPNGVAGTANTGGGGGGGAGGGSGTGGAGGSGVVIIAYPTGSIDATGGTITTSGGNTIHKFTSAGTFTVTSVGTWKYKRSITVTNSNTATLVNNQVKVTPFTDASLLNNTGLVGSWHFNEGSGTKTIDSSGNNNTGTFSGSNYWSTAGKNGSSFTSSSTNGMSLSNGSDANVTGDITVEAWIYPTSFSNNTIVHKDGQYSLTIESSGNITWADSSNWSFANFGSKNIGLVTNQWQHIVATKTAGTVKIYLNGVEKVSQAFGGALTSTANVMSIGCYSNATACYSTSYFLGKIDEVKVYNRALSSSEVQLRYGPLGVPKIRSDYADIRFSSSDGMVNYPYWQESDNKFWVKIPSLIVGDTNINMYYGNSKAASASNGDDTFPFFDDFSGSVINTAKWAELDAKGALTQSNGLSTTRVTDVWDSALISKQKFSRTAGLTVGGSYKTGASVAAPNHLMVGWGADQETTATYLQLTHGFYFNAGSLANVYELSNSYAGVGSYVANSANLFEVKLKTTGADYYNNGTAIYTGVGSSLTTSPMRVAIQQDNHVGTFYHIFVRQGSTLEPTLSAPGAETSLFKYSRL